MVFCFLFWILSHKCNSGMRRNSVPLSKAKSARKQAMASQFAGPQSLGRSKPILATAGRDALGRYAIVHRQSLRVKKHPVTTQRGRIVRCCNRRRWQIGCRRRCQIGWRRRFGTSCCDPVASFGRSLWNFLSSCAVVLAFLLGCNVRPCNPETGKQRNNETWTE